MADEQGEFYVDSQEEEVREVMQIEQANPIFTKTVGEQPKKVNLKIVDIPKQEETPLYTYFKINSKAQSESSNEDPGQFNFTCPFTEFYSKQQLIYQRFNNQSFNSFKGVTYFSGTFVQKNIIHNYAKEQIMCVKQLMQEYEEKINKQQCWRQLDDPLFDSEFESGNLFAVFKVGATQFDLVMQNDTNSIGNNQWFYFSVQNLTPNVQYTFSVVNFTKNDSLFNYGMAPAIFSTFLHEKKGTGWFRGGDQVAYKRGLIPRQSSRRHYYKLTFTIKWKYKGDRLYIAHSYPYTYTKLHQYLHNVANKYKDICEKLVVGKSLSKKPIQGLMITQKINKKRDNRKAIIVMARQHPGETQGSYVCEGVIDKLLQKCKESDYLRKNFVIFVIPMVNPDGVIFGHYRTNLAGKDLNRKWDSTEKDHSVPEVTCIKNFLQEIHKEHEIRFIIDLHGHSKKLNSFFYGNPCPDNPEHVRIFPYICSKATPAVQFYDCTFAAEQYKRKAARVYLSYLFKQLHVYTYESSFYGYFKQGKKQQFTIKQYQILGQNLVFALFTVLEVDGKGDYTKLVAKDGVNMFVKYMNELKNNKDLMEVGGKCESGSESKPEDGQINMGEITQLKKVMKKPSTPIVIEKKVQVEKNSSIRAQSRKQNRQSREHREVNKPMRHLRFLEISRVNSVLPDKYQLGLQPIRKKETNEMGISRNHSMMMRISTSAQTQKEVILHEYKDSEIMQSLNLSNSVRLDNSINQRRYSSIIKNTARNNNIIFKIEFQNEKNSSTVHVPTTKERKFFNAFTQTLITFQRHKTEKNRSSQLFPIVVDSPDISQRIRSNPIKYDTVKVGMKREAEIFLNGMVKKYLVEKQVKTKEQTILCMERPLSIKKKQIYKK